MKFSKNGSAKPFFAVPKKKMIFPIDRFCGCAILILDRPVDEPSSREGWGYGP
jgi:hypothetical protein